MISYIFTSSLDAHFEGESFVKCFRLRHLNMEKNEIFSIPQLKCIDGQIFLSDKVPLQPRPHSGRKSAKQSKTSLMPVQDSIESAKEYPSMKTSLSEAVFITKVPTLEKVEMEDESNKEIKEEVIQQKQTSVQDPSFQGKLMQAIRSFFSAKCFGSLLSVLSSSE